MENKKSKITIKKIFMIFCIGSLFYLILTLADETFYSNKLTINPYHSNPELKHFSVSIDNGLKIYYKGYSVTYKPLFVLNNGQILNWNEIPDNIQKKLWKNCYKRNKCKYGVDFSNITTQQRNSIKYVVLHRVNATKEVWNDTTNTIDIVPMNLNDIKGKIKLQGHSIILNNKVKISHDDILRTYKIVVINKTDVVIGGLNNNWTECLEYNKNGQCINEEIVFNWKKNSDGTWNISFDPTITIDEEEVITNSLLTNITAETGESNFTHLDISNTAPYDSLIGYWSFDGDAENTLSFTAYDFTSFDNDGVAYGNAVANSTNCLYGDCVQLDGNGDYVEVSDSASLDITGGFTICGWFYGKSDTEYGKALEKYVANDGFYLSLNYGTSKNISAWVWSAGSSAGGDSSTGLLELNTWQFICMSFSPSTYIKTYLDGSEVFSDTTSVPASVGTNDNPFYIGYDNGFNGMIDEVMLFNTTLTDQQILDIYNNQSARFVATGTQKIMAVNITDGSNWNNNGYNKVNLTLTYENNVNSNFSVRIGQINSSVNVSGLFLYMPFEWGRGIDISGSGNDVTTKYGGVFFNESGGLNNTGCFEFDGIDDYLYVPDTGTNLEADYITITAWIYPRGSGNRNMVSRANEAYRFRIDNTGKLELILYNGTNLASCDADDYLPTNDNWQFAAAIYNGTNCIFYLNGNKEVESISISGPLDYADEKLEIGRAGGEMFNGSIDELMLFRRVLSEDEIISIYQNTSKGYNKAYYTNYQNLSGNTITFDISEEADFIFPYFKFLAGNLTNPFYTPILKGDIIVEYYSTGPVDTEYPIFSNYWDDNGTLVGSGTGHFNVTVTSTNGTVLLEIDGHNITATNLTANEYNASYTFTSAGTYTYRWHSWGNGTNHNYNVSVDRSYTVNTSVDTEYPIFSSPTQTPPNNTEYVENRVYEFNITITSTNGTAGIEFNGNNYSLTNLSLDVYNFTIKDLSAGTYTYYFWAYGNGSNNLYNTSNTYSYTIAKNSSYVLDITGTSPITYGTASDYEGIGCPSQLTCNLYRNDTGLVSNPDNSVLAAGSYNYTFNTTGNTNYTTKSTSKILVVNKATLSASITNDTALTRTYDGTATNIGISESNSGDDDVVYKLYVNGVDKGSSYTQAAAGTYNIILNSTGGQNYSASANLDSETLIINKATPVGYLTSNLGWTINESQTVTIGYSENNVGDSDVVYKVYRDGVDKGSGETWSPSLGTYNYILNTTGGANWTANSSMDVKTLTVNDVTKPVINIIYPENKSYNINVSELNYTYSELHPGFCWYSVDGGKTNSTPVVMGVNFTNVISSEGSNTWTVYCNDTSNNINETSITFFKDTIYPAWSNNKTNLTAYTKVGESVYFNITLSDANPDSYIFSWYNGTDWENTTGTYTNGEEISITKTININIGDINWTWYFNDSVGNTNQTPIWGISLVDTISPYFVTIPANTTINYTQGFGVDFDATDETAFDSYSINWTTLFKINQSGWLENSTANIAAGTYLINITINDTSNNLNSTIYKVTVNKIAPQGSISGTSPIDYGIAADVEGTETNIGDADVVYKLFRDGIEVSNPDTSVLGAGTYNYIYNATGGQNYTDNSSMDTFTLVVNQVSSKINLTLNGTEGNITISQGNTIDINCSIINGDPSAILTLYRQGVVINSGTSPIGNTTTFNTVQVENITCIYSNSQNYTTSSETWWVNVTGVDTTPPNINIVYPGNNTYWNDDTIDINYTVSDAGGVDSCWYSNDTYSVNITLPNCANITNVVWAEGQHNVTIWANDTNNNINSSSIVFYIDLTPPNATHISPQNGTKNATTQQNMTVNATDDVGLVNITLFIYNNSGLVNQTTVNYSPPKKNVILGIIYDFLDGIYKWFWRIVDSAGNIFETGNRTITIDSTPPTFTNLQNFTHTVNTSFYFDLDASDNLVGVDTFSLNDTSVFSIDNDGVITNVTALDEIKIYWLEVTVNDTLLNSKTAKFYINITSITPTIKKLQIWRNRTSKLNVSWIDVEGNFFLLGDIKQKSPDGTLWDCKVNNSGSFVCSVSS